MPMVAGRLGWGDFGGCHLPLVYSLHHKVAWTAVLWVSAAAELRALAAVLGVMEPPLAAAEAAFWPGELAGVEEEEALSLWTLSQNSSSRPFHTIGVTGTSSASICT